MIKIKDLPAPTELTDKIVEKLTNEFKQTGKAVWKEKFIGEQLLKMSFDKCCYSECKLREEGKYLEVEHFHPKSLYPDEVIDWNNLLPISSAINKAKSNHDTKAESIINPRFDNPKEHLIFKAFRFKPKNEFGKRAIEVLNLNDTILWVNKRFEIGNDVVERLEDISRELQDFDKSTSKSTQKQNNLLRKLRNLFHEGTPQAEYSAVVASYLLHDDDFEIVKNILIKYQLWDEEFIDLENQLRFCALEVE